MRQVAQRVTGRYHLEPLNQADTAKYVKHRMRVGGRLGQRFPARRDSRDIPPVPRACRGLINVVADRALLAGYARESRSINRGLVRRAAAEVFGEHRAGGWRRRLAAGAAAAAMAGAAAVGTMYWLDRFASAPDEPAAEARVPAAAPAPRLADGQGNPRGPGAVRGRAGDHTPGRTAGGPGRAEGHRHRLRDAFQPCGGRSYEPGSQTGLPAGGGPQPALLVPARFGHLSQEPRPTGHTEPDRRGRRTAPGGVAAHGRGHGQPRIRRPGPSRTSLADLSRYWYGDSLMLWRPGALQGEDLAPGMEGEGVRWLRASLERIGGGLGSGRRCGRRLVLLRQRPRGARPATTSGNGGSAWTVSRARRRRSRSTPISTFPATPSLSRAQTDMSFILDALRKSETERQKAQVPGIRPTRPWSCTRSTCRGGRWD